MTLTNPLFAGSERLQRASTDSPPMSRGEADADAVRRLQQALIAVGVATMRRSLRRDGTLDGAYGGETVEAVRRYEERCGIANGAPTGIAGSAVLTRLDAEVPAVAPAPALSTPSGAVPRAETATTLGPSSLQLPTASNMLAIYRTFVEVNGKPCGQAVTNQCAVRMTVALARCDIGFVLDRERIEHVHSGTNPSCGSIGYAHNTGAMRVINYLRSLWVFESYSRVGRGARTAEQVIAAVAARPGIIYFEDCYTASTPSGGGDHIDYWNGSVVMNDLLDYNAANERDRSAIPNTNRWFQNARGIIYFLPIQDA